MSILPGGSAGGGQGRGIGPPFAHDDHLTTDQIALSVLRQQWTRSGTNSDLKPCRSYEIVMVVEARERAGFRLRQAFSRLGCMWRACGATLAIYSTKRGKATSDMIMSIEEQ